ncbi:branched-chain amino acid ABC transporter permease [Pseudaminobacter soli (ex Li et al. 2025)]|uniref:Branched-chain amino acid ABC transporter permease n=1 Tax=Pseudaminobacter soli (ex Li et al. 2025) TaxID=1295366 RepID=A0A2P7RMF4_9HYPH|nr:branched-chain amino acid ABC transporter permease [Mesorhizobium soli]PSJ51386.1 branched-chain amino acid ABC transporter permease [Mesorhizobium soli]
MKSRLASLVLLIAAIVVLALLPALVNNYWLRIATGALMWAGLACSWNMLGGYAGYINFGQSAFFGLGAYTSALLMGDPLGLPFFATIPAGIVVTAIFAIIIGAPTLRLRGAYFAIATWAFAEVLTQFVNVVGFTGGIGGLNLPPFLDERFFYFTMFAAAVLTYLVTWALFERSRFGLKVKALRDHEPAAEAMGINTALVKLQTFVLSAVTASVFGSIFAYWVTFINPKSVFGGDITDQMVVMVLLGGLGSLWGPAIGGVGLFVINRLLWMNWGDTAFYIAILGAAIVLVVLFLPNGIAGLFAKRPAESATVLDKAVDKLVGNGEGGHS